jgi:hypothetical protein
LKDDTKLKDDIAEMDELSIETMNSYIVKKQETKNQELKI